MASDKDIRLFLASQIETGREYSIEDITSTATSKLNVPQFRVAQNLCALETEGRIKFYDNELPDSLEKYLFSQYGIRFQLVVALVAFTAISVFLLPSGPLVYVRYALGTLFMGFLPGYAVTESLYPKENDLTPLETSALSIGLSLTFIPLAALLLNYTPWGIRLDSMLVLISIMTLGLSLVAAWRRFELLGNEKKLKVEK